MANRSSQVLYRTVLILFLIAPGSVVMISTPCDAEPDALNPWNLLWRVDQIFALDLRCCGQDNVRAPHLDTLAVGGARYTNIFSTFPVGVPSRSVFMTGMCQTSTDTHPLRSHTTTAATIFPTAVFSHATDTKMLPGQIANETVARGRQADRPGQASSLPSQIRDSTALSPRTF